jgi:hypothetical protein
MLLVLVLLVSVAICLFVLVALTVAQPLGTLVAFGVMALAWRASSKPARRLGWTSGCSPTTCETRGRRRAA